MIRRSHKVYSFHLLYVSLEDIQELVQPSTCMLIDSSIHSLGRCGLHFLLPPSILSAINNNYIYKMMAMGLSHLLRDDSSRYCMKF